MVRGSTSFNTASGMDCMQSPGTRLSRAKWRVSIPQAVWIACNTFATIRLATRRKSVSIPQAVWIACNSIKFDYAKLNWDRFNTASGMDCMQFWRTPNQRTSTSTFQYRKRYGLHAIKEPPQYSSFPARVSIPQAVWIACNVRESAANFCAEECFNTASGMDCMQ